MVSVQPGMIVRYCERDIPNRRYQPKQKSLNNLLMNHSSSDLSDKARKRIRKAVNWMVEITKDKLYSPPGAAYSMKVKIAFVTVTLPSAQLHCDKVITSNCLNQLLVELRKYHNVKNYVWKAEAQENGNLHYHIAIDSPIDYNVLRDRWNRIVNKLGYIDRYNEITGKKNPNSTDVHKVKYVKNIAAYISSYMAKKELRRPMCGKYWGCSQTLSRCTSVKVVEENEVHEEIERICNVKGAVIKQLDYCQVIYVDSGEWKKAGTPIVGKLYNDYLLLAEQDGLSVKRPNVSEINYEVNECSTVSEIAINQAAQVMTNQVEQLDLLLNFTATDKAIGVSIESKANECLYYTGSNKNFYSDNRVKKEINIIDQVNANSG